MAEEKGEEQGLEQKLEFALSSRVQHFKENTDTLTLASVRRLLEKDLGLEKFALDAHKKFIRECLQKELQGHDDGNIEKPSEDVEKDVNLSLEEINALPKQLDETKNVPKDSNTEDDKITEDSPIMGVLVPKKSESGNRDSAVDEGKIKKAIQKRADYFLANSETTTLAGVRRLLEEDLGLEKNVLDSFKKFISLEIDQVLNSPKSPKSAIKKKASESSKPSKDSKQKNSKGSRTKKIEKTSSEEESDPSGGVSDEPKSEVKPKKEAAPKRKTVNSKEPKKRRISEDNDHNVSRKKQKNTAKTQKEESASDDDGSTSPEDQSQSSSGKQAQRNAKSAPGYGKQVDNLKSIIKACGMSVPPTIYKKAKQVPEDEREAFIVEELQGVLSKEGLSKNPSEKEIKECRKRKERARELEGIDTSNIISSSRRRSTVNFFTPPPKPAVISKSEKATTKDKKKKEALDKEISDNNEEVKEEEEKLENTAKEEKKDGEENVEQEDEEEKEDEKEDEEDNDDDEGDEESDEFNEDDADDSD